MECRICSSTNLETALDLGLQPWANNFLSKDQKGAEEKYPLKLVYCTSCHCSQLDYTVPKEVMFSDHTYVSGTTKTLSEHFRQLAESVNEQFFSNAEEKSVLDIGSNDGTQLKHYQALGFDALGVESCERIANLAMDEGVDTVHDFFNLETVQELDRKFDLINASGVFFHLEELHSATKGVKAALADGGVFLVQFLYMQSIMENLAFDQIYHEHLLYYTLESISRLLDMHGLEPFDGYVAPIHGGSMMLFVGHKGERAQSDRLRELFQEEARRGTNSLDAYRSFAARVEAMRADTLAYLDSKKAEGKSIFGLGAPVKGNTFLNYCQIGTDYLDCLTERNAMREGLYSPGMHIPIVMEEKLTKHPDVYFVLAWNFKKEILKRNQDLIEQGVEFYFPVDPDEER